MALAGWHHAVVRSPLCASATAAAWHWERRQIMTCSRSFCRCAGCSRRVGGRCQPRAQDGEPCWQQRGRLCRRQRQRSICDHRCGPGHAPSARKPADGMFTDDSTYQS